MFGYILNAPPNSSHDYGQILVSLDRPRPATLSKRDSNAGVFLRILRNFSEQLFNRTLSVAVSAPTISSVE